MPRRARSSLEASRGFLAYPCSQILRHGAKGYPRVLIIQSDVPGHDLGDAQERNPITESSISAREQQAAWRGGPTATLPITFADPSPNHLVDEENSNLTTPPAAASPPLENDRVWPKVSVQLGGSCREYQIYTAVCLASALCSVRSAAVPYGHVQFRAFMRAPAVPGSIRASSTLAIRRAKWSLRPLTNLRVPSQSLWAPIISRLNTE